MDPNMPKLLNPEELQLTPAEAESVRLLLANPGVQKYFKQLHMNAMYDVLENEAETEEQKQKLIARIAKYKGVQYVCIFIENNFGTKPL